SGGGGGRKKTAKENDFFSQKTCKKNRRETNTGGEFVDEAMLGAMARLPLIRWVVVLHLCWVATASPLLAGWVQLAQKKRGTLASPPLLVCEVDYWAGGARCDGG
ncbi:MAG: hypothetical protein MJE68_00170, partial [Proteobacteria bacterium]|nr:hypothetical protein [Pseudomonadota bacterium]